MNMYNTQPNRKGGDSLDGCVSVAPTPMLYLLRILDDSPTDDGGPVIHDVKLKVNGEYRQDIVPKIILDDYRREQITAIFDIGESKYLDNFGGQSGQQHKYADTSTIAGVEQPDDQAHLYERIPKYLDYMYVTDYLQGWNTSNMSSKFNYELGEQYYTLKDPGEGAYQVNGYEYAVYMFDLACIKDKVRRVQAEVTVSNDYRIQVSEIFTKSSRRRRRHRADMMTVVI